MRDDNAPTTPSPGRCRAAAFAASLDVPEPPAGRYVTDLAAAGANERRVRREKAQQVKAIRRLLADAPRKPAGTGQHSGLGRRNLDWSATDWSRDDDELAVAMGCSSRAAYDARKRLGQPLARLVPRHRVNRALGPPGTCEREQAEREIAARVLRGETTTGAEAARLGLSEVSVRRIYERRTTREQRRDAAREKLKARNVARPEILKRAGAAGRRARYQTAA